MEEPTETEEIFEGKWYTHPPMRNALISGLLAGAAFILGHLKVIPRQNQNFHQKTTGSCP